MIFIFPEPDRNFKINQAFMKFYFSHPHTHLYEGSNGANFMVSGALPQVSYSGEVNNTNSLMFHGNFVNMFHEYHGHHMSVILDCSSHLINEITNYDVLGNAALTIGNSYGDTGIKVGNNFAYDYFHKKYPNCRLIAAAHYEDDPEERQFFLKEAWGDISNKKIKNCTRTAVRINCLCDNCNKEKRIQCLQTEDLNSSVFSQTTILNSCTLLHQDIHKFVANTDQMPELIKQGYKYFIFPNYCFYPLLQAQEYVKNLIKPEYRQEAISYIMLMTQIGEQ